MQNIYSIRRANYQKFSICITLHGGEGRESNFTNSAVAKIEPCSAESSSIVKSEQKI